MNPGYLSYIMIFIAITLLLSGWRRTLVEDISVGALTFFMTSWLAVMMFDLTISFGPRNISGIYLLLFLTWATLNWNLANRGALIRVWLSGLLIGLYYFLAVEAATGFSWFSFSLNNLLAVVITLLVIGLTRRVKEQLAILSGSLLFGMLLHNYAEPYLQGIRINHRLLADHWWLFVISTRGLSVAWKYFLQYSRQVYQSGIDLWKERKYK